MRRQVGAVLAIALIAALLAVAPGASAQPAQTKQIFVAPPLQWTADLLSWRPALRQGSYEFSNLTGGVMFGMSPEHVNALLPKPVAGITWTKLTVAGEFTDDIRYFWLPLQAVPDLRVGVTSCLGSGSYVVVMFRRQGLFRLSYRLMPDPGCTSTENAARELLGRYVQIGPEVALSVRYRTGRIDVVDVSDATAGYIVAQRWLARGK